ncbi:MAG: hypothetical protein V3573_04660 [Desulfovibrionaceae bacterium]
MPDARVPGQAVYDPAFYEHCGQKVARVFCGLDGVAALYRFGHVSAPGNSDLDFLFVVENHAVNMGTAIAQAFDREFTAEELWVVRQHDPMVLNRELAPELAYIRPATGLVRLHGPDIAFLEVAEPEHVAIKLAELLLTYYPYMLLTPPELTRWPLQFINAYKFVLQQAEVLGLDVERDCIDRMLERNQELRRRCRELAPEEVRRHYLRTYPFLAAHARHVEQELAQALQERFGLRPGARPRAVWHHGRVFSDQLEYRHHPLALYPLFARPESLPAPLRAAAEGNLKRMRRYRDVVRSACNGMGLYTPWYFVRLKKRRYVQGFLRNLCWS